MFTRINLLLVSAAVLLVSACGSDLTESINVKAAAFEAYRLAAEEELERHSGAMETAADLDEVAAEERFHLQEMDERIDGMEHVLAELPGCESEGAAYDIDEAESALRDFKSAAEAHETLVANAASVEDAQGLESEHSTSMAGHLDVALDQQNQMGSASHMCPESHMEEQEAGGDDH